MKITDHTIKGLVFLFLILLNTSLVKAQEVFGATSPLNTNTDSIARQLSFAAATNGQAPDRFNDIENKLNELSKQVEGLNGTVELSVNGVSIQELIRGIALSNNLNVNVDPNIKVTVVNNFADAKVKDVFLFLCKQYNLDLTFIGTIINFSELAAPPKAVVPAPKYVAKKVKVDYNKEKDALSFDLSNDSIAAVAKEFTRVTGKNIVFSPELSNRLLNGYVQEMPFNNAVDKMAFANDLKATPTEDNFFLLEKKDKELNNGGKAGSKEKGNAWSSVPGLSIKINDDKHISVNAVSTPTLDIIGALSNQLKINFYLFTEIKGNSTVNISDVTYDEFLKHLLNGTDYTFRKEGDLYLIGERNIEGLRKTDVVQLKYRTADKIIEIIPADLKKGVDVKAFPDLNSIILCGSQPRILEIEAFLRDIDKVVPVVVIEVMIIDVRDSKKISAGISAGLKTAPTVTSGQLYPGTDMSLSASSVNNIISGINGLGSLNLGKVTPNFYMNIKALETQGVIKVRSTPKLATLNGHEAKMSIGEIQYYLETQNTIIGAQSPSLSSAQQYKPVTAELSVSINPMVSGDDQITMDIKVTKSSFTARINPSAPPGSIKSDFQSLIRVKDQETVILGGLEENTTNDTGSGVPFLSRIPVIKWLFSTREYQKDKNKLTIFIKPTVIH